MEAIRASVLQPRLQVDRCEGTASRFGATCRCSASHSTFVPGGLYGSSLKTVSKVRLSTRNRLRVSAENVTDGSNAYAKGYNIEDTVALPKNFCLIEHRDTVQDFATMDLGEIDKNVESRRNKIFLLMEEVRRLKIQETFKKSESEGHVYEEDLEEQYRGEYPSALPLLPPLTDETLTEYYSLYTFSIAVIILFGGLVAPILKVKLGLGGQSYAEFVQFLHLPSQLSEVDPFVASFTGGAVGVISSLMLVEVNNVKNQAKSRCQYCKGTGYLGCGTCSGQGLISLTRVATIAKKGMGRCTPCSGTGKVMCTTCLCTGMALATEHDPRIDPFD